MSIPSKLFRPHPSVRGRVLCFFSRSGISVIWNDTIETQKNISDNSHWDLHQGLHFNFLFPPCGRPSVTVSQRVSHIWYLIKGSFFVFYHQVTQIVLPSAITADWPFPAPRWPNASFQAWVVNIKAQWLDSHVRFLGNFWKPGLSYAQGASYFLVLSSVYI